MSINTRTPAEQAVHDDTAAKLAAGQDPFGDDEDIVAPTIADQANEAAAAAADVDGIDEPDDADPAVTAAAADADATKTDEPAPTVAALEEIAADEPPAPRQAAPQFRVASQEAIDADTATLNAEKAAAFQKVMDGELDPAAYTAIEATVNLKLGRLLVQSALAEANAQTAAQAEATDTLALMNSAKKNGELDYFADAKAQKQFDTFLNVALEDPDNAGRPYAELLAESHANVLAVRGIAKASGTAKTETVDPNAKPEARTPAAGPLTLRGLPNASVAQTGGTVADAGARLKGPEYQAWFSKLTPAQKNAMVDD